MIRHGFASHFRASTADVCDRPPSSRCAGEGQLLANAEQDTIYRVFPDAQGTIRVTGFLPYTSFSSRVPDIAATIHAARAVDAGALRALDQSWVPFYCPHCDRSFCTEHWALTPTFNWGFDHYAGTCPAGHSHFIGHC